METIKTVLRAYTFDTSNPAQAAEYKKLAAELRAQGLKKSSFTDIGNSCDFHNKKIAPLSGKVIELETKIMFSDQWNTAPTDTSCIGLRLMDWQETVYPNKSYRQGYYLEQTEEMSVVRRNRYRCGYCGKQCTTFDVPFCLDCLASPHLSEKDLPLLRLKWIGNDYKRQDLTDAERDWLLPLYVKAQTEAKKNRDAEHDKNIRAALKKKHQKATAAADAEYYGMIWLLDNGIRTENVIYYDHTQTFCFGWRNKLSQSVVDELHNKLEGFPYRIKYEIED